MYSLTRLSTVNVYELVRFKISSVVHGGHNITLSAIFLVSRYALFFLLVFSCFDYYCNIFFLHFKFIQLIRSGDIEIQPGPIKNALKFCHWNLNSVLVHDRINIPLSRHIIQYITMIFWCQVKHTCQVISVTMRLLQKDSVKIRFVKMIQVGCVKAGFACILRTTCQ